MRRSSGSTYPRQLIAQFDDETLWHGYIARALVSADDSGNATTFRLSVFPGKLYCPKCAALERAHLRKSKTSGVKPAERARAAPSRLMLRIDFEFIAQLSVDPSPLSECQSSIHPGILALLLYGLKFKERMVAHVPMRDQVIEQGSQAGRCPRHGGRAKSFFHRTPFGRSAAIRPVPAPMPRRMRQKVPKRIRIRLS